MTTQPANHGRRNQLTNMQTTIATETLPAPASLEALAILIKAIKISNNGYIFAPSPYEATVAQLHPDVIKYEKTSAYFSTRITLKK